MSRRPCSGPHNFTLAPTSDRTTARSQNVVVKQGSSTLPTATSNNTYSFDAAGNLTTDGLRKFEYDASNRHSKTGVNDADEGAKAIYLHNAWGQRVFKSEPQVDYTAPNETTVGADFRSGPGILNTAMSGDSAL